MRTHYILCFFFLQWMVASNVIAQENILISDTLIANADMLKVLVQKEDNKLPEILIDGYEYMSSDEVRMYATRTKTNFFETRAKRDIFKMYPFAISNHFSDTAWIDTELKSAEKTRYFNERFPKFFLESSTSVSTASFAAWIDIASDTAKHWTFFAVNLEKENTKEPVKMILTDGERIIKMYLASSDPNFDASHPLRSLFKWPAMGVEFFENEESLGAFQINGGSLTKDQRKAGLTSDSIIWLHRDLDNSMKLVLVAAMSVLVVKNNLELFADE
jgi:hypothetical protein